LPGLAQVCGQPATALTPVARQPMNITLKIAVVAGCVVATVADVYLM
jgi:hypothetical protein